jgi:hypothetical protein
MMLWTITNLVIGYSTRYPYTNLPFAVFTGDIFTEGQLKFASVAIK